VLKRREKELLATENTEFAEIYKDFLRGLCGSVAKK
jgi:hypothetical protein